MQKSSRRELLIVAGAGVVGVAAGDYWSHPPDHSADEYVRMGAKLSFADAGEDTIVWMLLRHIDKVSYMDIGAHEPIHSNNTYLFYKKGGRGVLVEPNVDLIPALRGLRPRDTVLNIGIGGTEQREADYYCFKPNWLNTFDKEIVDQTIKDGAVLKKVVKMPLVPINRVIEEHLHGEAPDFLSIDTEGLDFAILKSMDFQRFQPKVICAETIPEANWDSEITRFLTTKDYRPRAVTYYNTIYVHKTHPVSV